MKHSLPFLGIASLLFLAYSCIKEVQVDYGGTLAFPVADISFVIDDLLDEATELTVDDDNAISLVHREDSIVHFVANDFLDDITEDVIGNGSTQNEIGEIEIDNYSLSSEISFQEFLADFNDPFLEQFFQNNAGTSTFTPSFSKTINKTVDLPLLDEFTFVEVDTGLLQLHITNDLFIDVNNLTVILHDEVANEDLGEFQFSNIPPGMTQTDEIYIINRVVNNDLSLIIPEFGSQGSTSPVLIDLNTQLKATLDLVNFQIVGGEAVLPSTEIFEDDLTIDFNLSDDIELTQVNLLDAKLSYVIKSDFPLELEVTILFPSAFRYGNEIVHTVLVQNTGMNDSIVGTIDFSTSELLLDQDADQPFNRLKAEVHVKINNPPSTPMVFEAEDQIAVSIELENLEVEKVFGYFGQFDEMMDPGTIDLGVDFDFIDDNSSPIFFDNPTARVEYSNSFGVPIAANMNIVSEGHIGSPESLNPPELRLDYPTIDMIGETVTGSILIDKNNSNVVNFLSNYTTTINYDGNAHTNPDGNTGELNFATKDSELTLHTEIDLPFKFSAESILYRDTAEALSLDLEDGLTIDDIAEAELKLLYENGLPMETMLNIYVQNAFGFETLIIEDVLINAASVNAQGRVEAANIHKGEVFIPLTQDQIRALDEAENSVFEIRLQSTNNGNTPVDILTSYGVNVKVGMKVSFGE